jgi:oligoendopeptidase F
MQRSDPSREASGLADPELRATETWNLAALYPDDEAFTAAKAALERSLVSIDRFAGRLGESPAVLLDALDTYVGLIKEFSRLHAYASMRCDEDTRIASRQGVRQEVELIGTKLSRHTSFLRPELLALPPATLERFLEKERLLAPYAHFLRNLARQRAHVLEHDSERIVAEAGLLLGGPSSLFGVLHNVEIPRPEATLSTGETVRLTPAGFARHRVSSHRADRKLVFETYFGAYEGFTHTLGVNLFEGVKTHLFRARARRYASCLEAALDSDNVPTAVYRNLIERVRQNLPLLHRYLRLRARTQGLAELQYYDLYGPLGVEPRRRYGVRAAMELVRDSATPLGPEYVAALERAFEDRWIDWHPVAGKRAGAYASGAAYEVHPYVLLNYNEDYESLTTMAHEMGHAMHSDLSNRTQPFVTADYPILLAEIASTFNEALLSASLLRQADTKEEKVFLLSCWLDGLRATLFRQTLFAEFELRIHEKAERGEALTGESLSRLYLDLLRAYHGHDAGIVQVDERYAVEWAAIPHFYYDFYVYQYATGIVAATSLSEAVLSGVPRARERYLALLSAGGSDYPLELLRAAGVDLEAELPYSGTFRAMARRMDELETLL